MNLRYYLWSLPLLLITAITPVATAEQRNVQPEEWAYTALRSLIEISQCSVNPSLSTNQIVTRQEFATILNTCKSTIEQQIDSVPDDLVAQQHRARLARLLRDFAPELTTTARQINEPEPVETDLVLPTVVEESEAKPDTPVPIVPPEPPTVSPPINQQPFNLANSASALTEQVTSVSQLQDVQPNDWAYEALRSLVENYSCMAGYPDGTFRGNQVLTRYEFAAGLNACMQEIEKQLVETGNLANEEDLAAIQRLQQEFASELTDVENRLSRTEGRVTNLENQQFAGSSSEYPIVNLRGETIFALADAFGGDPPGTGEANTTLIYLSRLQFAATFSGLDRLRLELSAGNSAGFGFGSPDVLNTNTALLSFQENTNNSIQLSSLEYRFPAFNNNVVFTIKPVGFSLSSVLTANSPFFDSGRGAISRFGEANPIFKIGVLDAGVGLDWLLGNRARLQLAYGARNADNPEDGAIFGGNAHAAGLQFLLLPTDNLLTGVSFIYGYSPDGRLNTFTGSAIADASGFINQRSNIYAVSGTLQWRISPRVVFSTWGGLVGTYASETNAFAVSTNYMFGLGFPDLFQQGNVLGVLFGQPPKLVEVGDFSGSSGLGEDGESYHVEVFYQFRVNNNISITPGFFFVTNPGNIEDNNNIFIGVLRTTFRF
ncbi:MAG: iron uptake porin [Symploca sp. SIO3E6]|nr:iron uptake porin [Caldora sp. SIO3E6]